MLRRKMWERLGQWRRDGRDDSLHKALIIEGARQTGKTYLVRRFGQEHYEDFAEVKSGKGCKLHTALNSLTEQAPVVYSFWKKPAMYTGR